jgi:hypothetical protein
VIRTQASKAAPHAADQREFKERGDLCAPAGKKGVDFHKQRATRA